MTTGPAAEIQRIRTHIEGRLAGAELVTLPFPHLIAADFFPADVYARILALNPFRENAGREWMSRKAGAGLRTGTPYHARRQINFHKDDDFVASPEAHAFWDTIRGVFLGDDWFPALVAARYRAYFELRFGALADDPAFFGLCRRELFLQRHEPGYYIGPHTDIPTRIFTCIFAFAERPGFDEYGTELCRHRDPLVRCWGNNHYPPDDFVVEKLAPYRPNNFLLFFKTRQSFHAVRAIDDTVPNGRYGMQFQFYEPPGGLFRDLSEPELMVPRHKREAAPAAGRRWWSGFRRSRA
jgi:hypothetical protein